MRNYFGKVPNYFGKVPNYFGKVPNYFGRVPTYFGKVPNYFGNVPKYFGKVPNYCHARIPTTCLLWLRNPNFFRYSFGQVDDKGSLTADELSQFVGVSVILGKER